MLESWLYLFTTHKSVHAHTCLTHTDDTGHTYTPAHACEYAVYLLTHTDALDTRTHSHTNTLMNAHSCAHTHHLFFIWNNQLTVLWGSVAQQYNYFETGVGGDVCRIFFVIFLTFVTITAHSCPLNCLRRHLIIIIIIIIIINTLTGTHQTFMRSAHRWTSKMKKGDQGLI